MRMLWNKEKMFFNVLNILLQNNFKLTEELQTLYKNTKTTVKPGSPFSSYPSYFNLCSSVSPHPLPRINHRCHEHHSPELLRDCAFRWGTLQTKQPSTPLTRVVIPSSAHPSVCAATFLSWSNERLHSTFPQPESQRKIKQCTASPRLHHGL